MSGANTQSRPTHRVTRKGESVYQQLALSPDKLAQFKSLLADKIMAPIDVLAAAGQQRVDPVLNPQELGQLDQDAQAQIDQEIEALLDPVSYAQYQKYLRTESHSAA